MEKTRPMTQVPKGIIRGIKNDYESFPHKKDITYAQYRLIVTTFNMLLMESMSTQGHVYKLPKGNGLLGIFKYKSDHNSVMNYQHYKETGEVLMLSNLHSNKYICKFTWIKNAPFRSPGTNDFIAHLMHFRACRYYTRGLAQKIKNELNINIFRDRYDYQIR